MRGTYLIVLLLLIAIFIAYFFRTYHGEKIGNVTKNVSNSKEIEKLATEAAEDLLENISQGNMTKEELSDYLG